MNRKTEKELFSLVSAQHDGLGGEDSSARLAKVLEGDPQAQRSYLELGAMLHELEELYHGHRAAELMEAFPSKRTRIIRASGWGLALAASLAAVLALVPRFQQPIRSEMLVDTAATVLMNDQTPYIAHVVGSGSLAWGVENTVEILQGELKPGMLDLVSGTLDVMLDNGVRFAFVAPVQMDLTSLQRLSLRSGKVVLNVPGLAEGLALNTPDAVLRAHTARVQISCGGQGPTLVNVEQGVVDVFTENQAGGEVRKKIVGKESVKIARGAALPVAETRWVTEPRPDLSLPPEIDNLHYVHYRFDDERGGTVANSGTIPNADGYLEGSADNPEYPAPRRVPGRFNRALEFSGHGEGMIADIKEFGTDEPGSVAFWIKMAPTTVPNKYEHVFAWHMYTSPGKGWHNDDADELACRIRINDSTSDGVVGAVRIEFRNQWICGTTDLRDGRWHHVTAVFHRGYYGTAIRHYLDGELARSSARGKTWFPRERHEDIGGGSIAVGRGYWSTRSDFIAPDESVGLRGMVDELYVFTQPVLPSYASSLHMKNSPNQVLDVAFVPFPSPAIGMLAEGLPLRGK